VPDSIEQIVARMDLSFWHQFNSCFVGAPIGGGLLGLIAAKKGSRGKGFVYGTIAKLLVCPVAAGMTSVAPNTAGVTLSSLLQMAAPILASYYGTRR